MKYLCIHCHFFFTNVIHELISCLCVLCLFVCACVRVCVFVCACMCICFSSHAHPHPSLSHPHPSLTHTHTPLSHTPTPTLPHPSLSHPHPKPTPQGWGSLTWGPSASTTIQQLLNLSSSSMFGVSSPIPNNSNSRMTLCWRLLCKPLRRPPSSAICCGGWGG